MYKCDIIENSHILWIRFLPTKKNKVVWGLEKEIYAMIMDIVKKHNATTSEDMLQTLMEGSMNGKLGPSTADQFIVDNCKDIYLGAFEVNAVVAIWGLMLLASHPEWQARVRSEVQEVCGDKPPDANMLGKMKVVCCTYYFIYFSISVCVRILNKVLSMRSSNDTEL